MLDTINHSRLSFFLSLHDTINHERIRMSPEALPPVESPPATAASSYRHPWLIALIAGLASFVDGAALSANGWALVILQEEIGLTPGQFGALTASVTVGLAIGALVGGRLGDVYGRRKVFIVTMAIIVVATLAPMFSQNFWVILAGLALLGFGVGADLPVSLATIAEAATDKNRGAMLGFTQVLWVVGSMAVILVTIVVGGWGLLGVQVLYGIVFVVGLIGLLLRLTVPESPLWLKSREERRAGVHTVRADNARLSDLFQPPLRRPLLVLIAFYGLVSISGNVIASYIAYIATNVAGIPIEAISGPAALLYPFGVIALLVFMKLVDTRHRMPMYLLAGIVFPLAYLIPVFFGINLVTILATVGLAAVAGALSGGEPMARVWTNESFPTLLRSTGQGVVFTVGRIMVAIASAIAPAVIAVSPDLFFIGLAVAAGLGILIGWLGFRGGRIVNEFDHEQHLEPAQG